MSVLQLTLKLKKTRLSANAAPRRCTACGARLGLVIEGRKARATTCESNRSKMDRSSSHRTLPGSSRRRCRALVGLLSSSDGKEIFYLAGNTLMSAAVTATAVRFEVQRVHPLFAVLPIRPAFALGLPFIPYDVSQTGSASSSTQWTKRPLQRRSLSW